MNYILCFDASLAFVPPTTGYVDGPPSQWPELLPASVTRHSPPRLLGRLVVASPLLTPPSPICRHLSLSCLLTSHSDASHLPAPPPLIVPSPIIMLLSGPSSSWFRHHLSPCHCHLYAGSSEAVSGAD